MKRKKRGHNLNPLWAIAGTAVYVGGFVLRVIWAVIYAAAVLVLLRAAWAALGGGGRR